MKLADDFYQRIQDRVRARLSEDQLDGLIVTVPGDVAYLIGFFYAVTERPVYLWFGRDGSRFALLPELDAEYAAAQGVHADIRTYFEYPGVRTPEQHLADELAKSGTPLARIGVSGALTIGARAALVDALPASSFIRTRILSDLRLRKEPEEIELHRQAAEVCDEMLGAGRALIEGALRSGDRCPPRATSPAR
ncbi:aminopeptidase P family N-terminal domain-containing protein [Microbacterium sp. Se5.02b]|uniref:aminopeptidase P family N-terminal domain-containing protein n=1 Tax=Microbacterium sp. Se5.02b TaxID=2864103 RepID=UPI00215D826C|nr:aminopeptidase P family N-terminal domain-containing protein [Microbacterium sp. Se5.02b]